MPDFTYNFTGLGAPETAIVREQIRARIKVLRPYEQDKTRRVQIAVLEELDTDLGEHYYQESLKLSNKM